MSLFYRPIVTYPVRCGPSFLARPVYPAVNDFANIFSALDDSLQLLDQAQRHARRQRRRLFVPKFNVKENNDAYSLEGELPGINAKDLKIEFTDDGHTLQISGTVNSQAQKVPAQESTGTLEQSVEEKSQNDAVSTTSDTPSRSLQATVEDEVEGAEQPANATAAKSSDATPPAESVAQEKQQAEAQQQPAPEATNWLNERYTGSFQRTFQFPSKVDQEMVKASLKDGILSVTLPFARKPASRTIQIE